jgi:flagellar hook-length control protein FliK
MEPSFRVGSRQAARPSRHAPGPVAVAGKPSTSSTLPGRPAVAVPRIVEAAVLLRPGKSTRLCVALHPEHLGELVIELSLRGGLLQGVVLAESEAAREAISAHLDQLRSDLERKGIRVGDFQVLVAVAEPPESLDRILSLRPHVLDLLA